MKLKKLIAAAMVLAAGIELFAVKLPDGKNVRSDEVTSYKSGALESVKLREDTEITTPIGTVMVNAREKIYYYENGTVKSIVLTGHEINGNLKIKTNFASEDGSTGVINGLTSGTILTFYENGALWRIDGNGTSFSVQTPNGTLPLEANLFFYESDGTQPPIIQRAFIADDKQHKLPAEIIVKGGTFTLKGHRSVDRIETAESMRYGKDGYPVSFYKNGAIKKLYINDETAKNCVLNTVLGEVFVKATPFPLMFWEDGSVKQCTVDDVMQVEIYGKKVQIPTGGLLRFRRDGSVWAYTTDQKISYKIGKETYTANDPDACVSIVRNGGGGILCSTFDTVVLDEKGTLEQVLYREGTTFLVQSFYTSGRVKKCMGGMSFLLENKKGYADINDRDFRLTAVPNINASNYYGGYNKYYTSAAPNVYMLYFADNGYPSSYDVFQPVSGLPLTLDNLEELGKAYRFLGSYI